MPNAYISGTGSYVPPRVVTNSTLAREWGIDTTDEWIQQRTGIKERRFAEAGVTTSDLALPAAEEAIRRAGLDKTDIDMIVFATLSPDCHFPGTGVYLQKKLGLTDGDNAKFVPALDIRNQCSGFVYGLATAASMVQSGGAASTCCWSARRSTRTRIDLTTRGRQVASLFGDGAGAVVVSATDEDRGVRGWWLGADGRFADSSVPEGLGHQEAPYIDVDEQGRGVVSPEMMWAHMDGKLVFKQRGRADDAKS